MSNDTEEGANFGRKTNYVQAEQQSQYIISRVCVKPLPFGSAVNTQCGIVCIFFVVAHMPDQMTQRVLCDRCTDLKAEHQV